jgi:WD40 repeat protein
VIGFSRDSRQFFTALTSSFASSAKDYGVRVWDTFTGKPLFEIPDMTADIKSLVTGPKDRVLIGPDRDYALGIWDRRAGERLGTLRPMQESEWLVTTPSGLFDGSPRGWTGIACAIPRPI